MRNAICLAAYSEADLEVLEDSKAKAASKHTRHASLSHATQAGVQENARQEPLANAAEGHPAGQSLLSFLRPSPQTPGLAAAEGRAAGRLAVDGAFSSLRLSGTCQLTEI